MPLIFASAVVKPYKQGTLYSELCRNKCHYNLVGFKIILIQNPVFQLSHLCFVFQKSVCIDCNGEEYNPEDNHDGGVLGEVGLGSEIIFHETHYFLL